LSLGAVEVVVERRTGMVRTATKTTAACLALGAALWYGAAVVTGSSVLGVGLLVAVGVLAPTLLNQWRLWATD
jgi:hypothetical protein